MFSIWPYLSNRFEAQLSSAHFRKISLSNVCFPGDLPKFFFCLDVGLSFFY